MKMLFLLTLLAASQATGNRHNFHHEVRTTARPAAVWHLWTTPATWPSWDSGLRGAQLEGTFQAGAQGQLQPDRGPATTFEVMEAVPDQRTVIRVRIPLGWMYLRRSITAEGESLRLRHAVEMTGPMKVLLGWFMGGRYRKMLVDSVLAFQRLAEEAQP
jgi:uncharacterized protein YndB with AHSA1/START domain